MMVTEEGGGRNMCVHAGMSLQFDCNSGRSFLECGACHCIKSRHKSIEMEACDATVVSSENAANEI